MNLKIRNVLLSAQLRRIDQLCREHLKLCIVSGILRCAIGVREMKEVKVRVSVKPELRERSKWEWFEEHSLMLV